MDVVQQCDRLIELCGDAWHSTVVAGYFALAPTMPTLSHESLEAAASFALGARLVAALRRRGRSSQLVLPLDDIGLAPERRAELKRACHLPCNYRSILDAARLRGEAVTVLFESTLRDLAATRLGRSQRRFGGTCAAHTQPASYARDARPASLSTPTASFAFAHSGGALPDADHGRDAERTVTFAALFDTLARTQRPDVQVNILDEFFERRAALAVDIARTQLGLTLPIVNVFCDGIDYRTQRAPADPAPATVGPNLPEMSRC